MLRRLINSLRKPQAQTATEAPTPNAQQLGSAGTPVIYDFGMNNGDDVEYFLLKCDTVVAVEANASLCEVASDRFSREIASGRLTILNVALADEESAEPLTFYIHKTNHVLSQLPEPDASIRDQFEAVSVECRTPSSIVQEFGPPLYIKIDVEYYDLPVLRDLFAAGVHPPEISAESHSAGVYACLVENGYDLFSLVDGRSVAEQYANKIITSIKGPRRFSFKDHSAGPFGDDIRTPWQNADEFLYTLAKAGLGWKDIHATHAATRAPGRPLIDPRSGPRGIGG